MKRNLIRALILVWLGLVVHDALASYTDTNVPVVVAGPVTPENPSGEIAQIADYRCAAPWRRDAEPRLLHAVPNLVRATRTPCEPWRNGRRALIVLDVVLGLVAFVATFMRGRWFVRRRRATGAAAAAAG
ncbi:MAG TPA: hypothetical protein VGQ20_15050 [Acidimicrobiales bacterium]|nr:hypothetical protein [Acidimicrobiales bacterium]